MLKMAIRSYKTTGLGAAAGILNLVLNGMTWKQALMSLALGGLGVFAKDSDVSGPPPQGPAR